MNTLRSEAIYGKRVEIKIVYPVRNNAPLLCSGVRFQINSGGV
jgi:hypothetical protein